MPISREPDDHRSSVTGQYVTADEAAADPAETVAEHHHPSPDKAKVWAIREQARQLLDAANELLNDLD